MLVGTAACALLANGFVSSHGNPRQCVGHRKQATRYDFLTESRIGDGPDHDVLIENVEDLEIYAPCVVFTHGFTIRDCTIDLLELYNAYFHGGLEIINCTVTSTVNWAAGGHNHKPVVLRDCVFEEFVDCSDISFWGPVLLERVKFYKGTTLLDKGMDGAFFKTEPTFIDVEGRLDVQSS